MAAPTGLLKTIAFHGTCLARSVKTLCGPRINSAMQVQEILATFPLGCVDLLHLSFILSADDQTPSSGVPSGTSILRDLGQVDYLAGDGCQKRVSHQVDYPEQGSFIKVYAVNTDYYDHSIDAQVIIQLYDRP